MVPKSLSQGSTERFWGPKGVSIEPSGVRWNLQGFDTTFLRVRSNLFKGSIEPFWGGRRFQGTVLRFPLAFLLCHCLQVKSFLRFTIGPKMITHTFFDFELISQLQRTSVTHGFLAGIILCNLVPSKGTFCERANYTYQLFGHSFSNCTHICYTKKKFPSYLCNHFGLIVLGLKSKSALLTLPYGPWICRNCHLRLSLRRH